MRPLASPRPALERTNGRAGGRLNLKTTYEFHTTAAAAAEPTVGALDLQKSAAAAAAAGCVEDS